MNVLEYFPCRIGQVIKENLSEEELKVLEEIRIRCCRPVVLKLRNNDKILNYIISTQDILEIVEKITENSMYSYQKQLCSGYITLKGGHRVGISGNVVMEEDKVININYIYSLNFRIARQIIGVSEKILSEVINNDNIYNTLIRNISKIKTVGVVDERGEITAMYKNEPQNDMGLKVDILSNVSKAIGMKILVRSMAPDLICADEIGTKEDIEAIKYAITSGVKGIFTAHGDSVENIQKSPILKELLELNIIDKIIILNKKDRDRLSIIKI